MNDLVFVDTETTGLDYNTHDIWEIAWAVNDGPIESRVVVHSLKTADFGSLAVNNYLERFPNGARSEGPVVDLEIRRILTGNTLVSANPPFDRGFLHRRWDSEPWHYRSINVESMALGILGHERPIGLSELAEELSGMGYIRIDMPDHTAAKDVEVLRECFWALRAIQRGKRNA